MNWQLLKKRKRNKFIVYFFIGFIGFIVLSFKGIPLESPLEGFALPIGILLGLDFGFIGLFVNFPWAGIFQFILEKEIIMNINKVNCDLSSMSTQIHDQKKQLLIKLHQDIDSLIDDEIDMLNKRQEPPTFGQFIRGMYYLTLAKYTDPVAYKMAHRVAGKLRAKQINP